MRQGRPRNMADKPSKGVGSGTKPVPMKLYAAWEVEKTSPNCIPRLCSLTLTRLIVLKPLESELNSIIVAVQMQSSKRLLRSNEIILPPGGLLDTDLDLSFSLQYPHFLKRDGNKLLVMLQRRKKYKNRTILGYKTLAVGQISMAQVLQRSVDRELNLYSDLKDRTNLVAQVIMLALSSQPVDHIMNGQRKHASSDADRSPDVDNDSDEDDVHDDNDAEDWSNEELSDSEPMMIDEEGRTRPRKSNRSQIRPAARQRNIKQRFIALLKKFKMSEEALDSEADHDLGDPDHNREDIDELFDELEDLSDSGPELDTMSVQSTPKPRLRPFFTGRSSGNNEELIKQDSGRLSDENSTKKNDSEPHAPRKVLLDHLSSVLGTADDKLPDSILLINTAEWQGQLLFQKLQENQLNLICTCSQADVKAVVSLLVAKIQKFCNSNSKSPSPIKVGVAGGDGYINSVLRPYVEQFSVKSPDWQNHIRFLVIPFGPSSIGKHIASVDTTYGALFLDTPWKDTFEKSEMSKLDSQEIINRVCKYMSSAQGVVQIPIAEAMVMYKSKSTDDESSQVFIPFLSEVKIGSPEVLNSSVEYDEGAISPPSLSSSPPASTNTFLDKPKDLNTPPSSPNVSAFSPVQSGQGAGPISGGGSLAEFMDLQVDYWTFGSKAETTERGDKASKKDSNKISLKTTFRSLLVHWVPLGVSQTSESQPSFSMDVVTREKKQKIMRLGKKPKDIEAKSQVVEGINRLICTTKSQNYSLKVSVDGVDWTGVKFFQLSSQWQTHIKHFPVAVFHQAETVF